MVPLRGRVPPKNNAQDRPWFAPSWNSRVRERSTTRKAALPDAPTPPPPSCLRPTEDLSCLIERCLPSYLWSHPAAAGGVAFFYYGLVQLDCSSVTFLSQCGVRTAQVLHPALLFCPPFRPPFPRLNYLAGQRTLPTLCLITRGNSFFLQLTANVPS